MKNSDIAAAAAIGAVTGAALSMAMKPSKKKKAKAIANKAVKTAGQIAQGINDTMGKMG